MTPAQPRIENILEPRRLPGPAPMSASHPWVTLVTGGRFCPWTCVAGRLFPRCCARHRVNVHNLSLSWDGPLGGGPQPAGDVRARPRLPGRVDVGVKAWAEDSGEATGWGGGRTDARGLRGCQCGHWCPDGRRRSPTPSGSWVLGAQRVRAGNGPPVSDLGGWRRPPAVTCHHGPEGLCARPALLPEQRRVSGRLSIPFHRWGS